MPNWKGLGPHFVQVRIKKRAKQQGFYYMAFFGLELLAGVIAEEMYEFLDANLLLLQEQKGCRRKPRGTNDLLFIDKLIMQEVKTRKQNLSMAWIDYKKVYDIVPHSWIIDCLETVGINKKIRRFFAECMELWQVEWTPGKGNLERLR